MTGLALPSTRMCGIARQVCIVVPCLQAAPIVLPQYPLCRPYSPEDAGHFKEWLNPMSYSCGRTGAKAR